MKDLLYIKGFPETDNESLSRFMIIFFAPNYGNPLFMEDGVSVNAIRKGSEEFSPIQYFSYGKVFRDFYKPLLGLEDVSSTLNSLQNKNIKQEVFLPVKPLHEYNLPLVELEKKNRLRIKTMEGEKTLNLPGILNRYSLTETDRLSFNIRGLSKESMAIEIQQLNKKESGSIFLFVKSDFSTVTASKLVPDELQNVVDSEELKNFEDLFVKTDPSGEFFNILHSETIWNKKEHTVFRIHEKDVLLSDDGKFVYLNGTKESFKDGIQRIQTIENYKKGNEKYEKVFKIDFMDIAKELNLKADSVNFAHINFFYDDLIVLSVDYEAKVVGTAGFTNVLIDLNEDSDNSKAYLVDLGVQ
ncbi:hypothetical protein [Peribacillus sp. NPDC097077]|uniref:hypothetical protein n=1 Tax=Peribacillus sp. NPDC097077 TaxID=3390613 RepID=UPI003D04E47F